MQIINTENTAKCKWTAHNKWKRQRHAGNHGEYLYREVEVLLIWNDYENQQQPHNITGWSHPLHEIVWAAAKRGEGGGGEKNMWNIFSQFFNLNTTNRKHQRVKNMMFAWEIEKGREKKKPNVKEYIITTY